MKWNTSFTFTFHLREEARTNPPALEHLLACLKYKYSAAPQFSPPLAGFDTRNRQTVCHWLRSNFQQDGAGGVFFFFFFFLAKKAGRAVTMTRTTRRLFSPRHLSVHFPTGLGCALDRRSQPWSWRARAPRSASSNLFCAAQQGNDEK